MTVTHDDVIEVPRGLKGVVVTETELGDVQGQQGFYHYRQYSAVELAERRGSRRPGTCRPRCWRRSR